MQVGWLGRDVTLKFRLSNWIILDHNPRVFKQKKGGFRQVGFVPPALRLYRGRDDQRFTNVVAFCGDRHQYPILIQGLTLNFGVSSCVWQTQGRLGSLWRLTHLLQTQKSYHKPLTLHVIYMWFDKFNGWLVDWTFWPKSTSHTSFFSWHLQPRINLGLWGRVIVGVLSCTLTLYILRVYGMHPPYLLLTPLPNCTIAIAGPSGSSGTTLQGRSPASSRDPLWAPGAGLSWFLTCWYQRRLI